MIRREEAEGIVASSAVGDAGKGLEKIINRIKKMRIIHKWVLSVVIKLGLKIEAIVGVIDSFESLKKYR